MTELMIIDNYDSFTYNLVQLVKKAGVRHFRIVKNDRLLALKDEFEKVLISPGPGVVAEAGQLLPFLKNIYQKSSILGICLGQEALVEFFGGRHVKLPHPLHGFKNKGKVIRQHYLFEGLPEIFCIGHYHSWVADEGSLSTELNVLMKDENGHVMAVSHRKFDIIGLQFHPESVMTEHGLQMIGNWLTKKREAEPTASQRKPQTKTNV